MTNIYAELITNGDFSNGMTGWFAWTNTTGGRTADFNVVGGELVVNNINGGGAANWISVLNSNVSLVHGTTYTVSFDARSTAARQITVGPRRGGPGYTSYSFTVVLIDAVMKTYSFAYTHTAESDTSAQLIFSLGETDDAVYIDNVSMIEFKGAYNPFPAVGSGDANVDMYLSWSIPSEIEGALSNVYFGTSPTPPLVSSGQTGTIYHTPVMDYLTTYYWRIDLVHGGDTYPGNEWTFRTGSQFGPAKFELALGPTEIVPDTSPAGVPQYPWFPDGHITFIPDLTTGDYQMYWAGSSSYRTTGTSMTTMNDPGPSVITKGASGSYDNGGVWLMSVFRQLGENMIGFYHAEDHEFPPYDNPGHIAWKSSAVCTSSDNGVTWTKIGQIITSATPKPRKPTWGGGGDHCVVYDDVNARWVCYYSEHNLRMAVSYDPDGAPGTWYKYYNGNFTQPGLGGQCSPIPVLQDRAGANPSVHYNTYLNKWVMVWHSWSSSEGSIWLSTSTDMINWDTPISIVSANVNEKIWYPTIIGSTDTEAGQEAWLCYDYAPDTNNWQRQFIRRKIIFEPADVNGDRKVNLLDFSKLALYWQQNEPSVDIAPPAGDGVINFLDLLVLTERWLVTIN